MESDRRWSKKLYHPEIRLRTATGDSAIEPLPEQIWRQDHEKD
jgi:hypothetical protein